MTFLILYTSLSLEAYTQIVTSPDILQVDNKYQIVVFTISFYFTENRNVVILTIIEVTLIQECHT